MTNSPELAQKSPADQSGAERLRDGPHFIPRVDIYETDKELILYADLPGVAPADIDLHYERGELVLQGKVARQSHNASPLVAEYEEGDFCRVFQVHESIDGSRIAAECKNGVLAVHLPKEEAAQPKKINVRG